MSKPESLHARVVEALRNTCTNDCGRRLSSSLVAVCRNCLLADELADKAIVPREPDKAMRDAGGWVVNDCRQTDLKTNGNDVATLAFRAMLRASDEQ